MREQNMNLIKQAVKTLPQFEHGNIGVYPIAESKNNIFRVETGQVTLKARVLPFEPACLKYHEYLLENTEYKVPKIVDIVKIEGYLIKIMEWIPGKNLREQAVVNDFIGLPDSIIVKWGECVAKLHNIRYDGLYLSLTELWWWNFLYTENHEVVLCDTGKLTAKLSPENDVVIWIISNLNMTLQHKKCFLDGYCRTREFNRKLNNWEAFLYFAERINDELVSEST